MYNISKDKITITNKQDFNIAHILECGQVFRYAKLPNSYVVYSNQYKAEIFETDNGYEIITNNVDYFVNYFDLKTDYSQIKEQLRRVEKLSQAIDYGYGIRILNQDPLESIISFIISANNNIPRIKKSLNGLCEKYGNKIDDYFAFPTIEQLSKISQSQFEELGTGYRASQLVKAIAQLQNIDLERIRTLDTETAIEELLKISGVGPKVADCVLLFGYHNMQVFPVDTWIEKMYNAYFSETNVTDRKLIRKLLTTKFGNLSGYAQQYLFYFKRYEDGKNK